MNKKKVIELIDRIQHQRLSQEKNFLKKSMIPEFLWEPAQNNIRLLTVLEEYLTEELKDSQKETRAPKKPATPIVSESLGTQLDEIIDYTSLVHNEARYIRLRNNSVENSLDKMSAEQIIHFISIIEKNLANIKKALPKAE